MSEAFNSVPMVTVLSEIFSQLESFSGRAYYDKMVQLFPSYNTTAKIAIPTEKEIQKWILEENEFLMVEGKTSVPLAEKEIGVKIGEDYVYPNGMTDLEYNINRVRRYGLCHYTNQCDFSQVVEFMEMVDDDEESKGLFSAELKAAYVCAWQSLHFHNYDEKDRVLGLQKDFSELCRLNPQLNRLKIDTNDAVSLTEVCNGVSYGFPVEDIQLFVSEREQGRFEVAYNEHSRIREDIKKEGLPDGVEFGWVLSTETIKKVGERLRIKERKMQQTSAIGAAGLSSRQLLKQGGRER
ncbi:MAG: hypothetical protein NC218_06265 [Acetobacter sp.]|nr:hypothetical protein [Acetobacter sp.]